MQRSMTYALFAAGIGLGVVAYFEGGWSKELSGLTGTGKLLGETALLIVAACVLAGCIQALTAREAVGRWLGEGSGWRGR